MTDKGNQQYKPIAWIRICNIRDKPTGIFLADEDGKCPEVELRSERMEPLYCEESLTAEQAKNARLVADLDYAWEQFRRMRALLAEAKYGDRLKNQVDVNAMKEKQ